METIPTLVRLNGDGSPSTILGRSWVEEGCQDHQKSSRRRRLAGGAATPPRRPAAPKQSARARPGRGKVELGLMEGPPGPPPTNRGASPPAWTRPAPGGPPPPPPKPGPRKLVDTGSETRQSLPPTPAPPGCGQPRPRPHPSPRAPACAPRRETPWQGAPGTILEICKLWEQGPLEREEMSSSPVAETEKKLEKLDEKSERENRKEAESKKKEES